MFGRKAYTQALELECREKMVMINFQKEEIIGLQRKSEEMQREIKDLKACLDEECRTITSMRGANMELFKQRNELREALAEIGRLASPKTKLSGIQESVDTANSNPIPEPNIVAFASGTKGVLVTATSSDIILLRRHYRTILNRHRAGIEVATRGLCRYFRDNALRLEQVQMAMFIAAGLNKLYPFGKHEFIRKQDNGDALEASLRTNRLRLLWVTHIASHGRPEDFKSLLPTLPESKVEISPVHRWQNI